MALSVKKIGIGVCFALMAAGASGCSDMTGMKNPFGGNAGNASNAQQAMVDGKWVDPTGVVSTFNNGVFETRAADTGEKMAEGNYSFGANNIITIEVRSLVRGTISHVNCSPEQSKLYCTTQDNKQFILNRG